MVEQGTHKPLVGGSNPPSATNPADELAAIVVRGAARLGVTADASLLLAVSGGADSMALLHGAVRAAAADGMHWRLRVAHLDHGLRPDSADHARFVANAAAVLGIPCVVERVDVGASARDGGRSIEQAGRDARYRFLEETAGPDELIATAHTASDSAETVLLNLLRGTGLSGLRGIPARRGRVVRPLIAERPSELRALLVAAGISYRDDPSNADPSFLRNRVRAEVLPLLERLRPGAVERIGRFARLAGDDDELLDDLATVELTSRRTEDGAIDWHDAPARALGRRILRLAIGDPAPSAERIDSLLDAAEGDRGGLTIELGAGRSASVRERRIRIG